jgi:anti-sigma B factor antagonist
LTISEGVEFGLQIARLQSRIVVSITGEVDALTAAQLRHCLDDLVLGQGNRDLVLDMHSVTFLDSTGLGVIVGASRRLRELGGELTISAPSRPVSAVLETTGLTRALIITAT